jgi:hypothetical protein
MQDIITNVTTSSIEMWGYFTIAGTAFAAGLLWWFYLPLLFRGERKNYTRDPSSLVREGAAMALTLFCVALCFSGAPLLIGFLGFVVAGVILLTSKARFKAGLVFFTAVGVGLSWPFLWVAIGQ